MTTIIEPSPAAAAAGTHRSFREYIELGREAFVASDPGLNRLLRALELVVAISVSIGFADLFMQLTHVMWLSVPPGVHVAPALVAELAAQHHGITLLAMMLAGMIAMMSVFAVAEPRISSQAWTLGLMPVPLLASMSVAIALANHHDLGIAAMAVVMGIGTYFRKFIPKFGARMFVFGALLFVGFTFGFLSRGAIQEHMLGWIAVLLVLMCALNFLLKLGIARPLARGRLGRTERAFRARGRAAMGAAAALFEIENERELRRARRRLRRALVKVNETALVIDASLADEYTAPEAAGHDAHVELFELELLVQELGRLAERLADRPLAPTLRDELRGWLQELRAGELTKVAAAAAALESGESAAPERELGMLDRESAALVHRFARTIVALQQALRHWPRYHRALPIGEDGGAMDFASPVMLAFGDLPGSAIVSAQTAGAATDARGWPARVGLDPFGQAAMRLTIAVGAAGAVGSVLSERRFYWAVIAVFITFMGTNTSGEQVVKAANRVGGTVIGILIGSLLASAVGVSTWSIVVIIAALAFGIYFMKVSYGLMVIGITIMVSQLYEQLDEFSNHLLVLRLEETAIGAAIAVLCALVIFPVPTRRVAATAVQGYLAALAELLERAAVRLRGAAVADGTDGGAPAGSLTGASRALDYAIQQFLAAARPLRWTQFRRDRLEHNVALITVSAHHARRLAAVIDHNQEFAPLDREQLAEALTTQQGRAQELAGALAAGSRAGTGGDAAPERLGDLPLSDLERALEDGRVPAQGYQRQLLGAVELLDETLAELRANLVRG